MNQSKFLFVICAVLFVILLSVVVWSWKYIPKISIITRQSTPQAPDWTLADAVSSGASLERIREICEDRPYLVEQERGQQSTNVLADAVFLNRLDLVQFFISQGLDPCWPTDQEGPFEGQSPCELANRDVQMILADHCDCD